MNKYMKCICLFILSVFFCFINSICVEAKGTKYCFIGDSRFKGMKSAVSSNDITWICEDSKAGTWVKKDAQWTKIKKLDKNTIIVYEMGVNNITSIDKELKVAKEIVGLGFVVYYSEIMPVWDSGSSSVTSKQVEAFNKELNNKAGSYGYKVIKVYDKYKTSLKESDYDSMGVHYNSDVYKQWYDDITSQLGTVAKNSDGSTTASSMSVDDIIELLDKTGVNSGWSKDKKQAQAECVGLIISALKADGYTNEATAGVLCNMQGESAFDPFCCEGYYGYKKPFVDYIEYKKKGTKSFTITDYGNPPGGVGISQWTYGRHSNFDKYCNKKEHVTIKYKWKTSSGGSVKDTTSVGPIDVQVAFLIQENAWNSHEGDAGYPKVKGGLKGYKKLTDAKQCAILYCCCWEVPKNYVSEGKERAKQASNYLKLVENFKGVSNLSTDAKQDATKIAQNLTNVWSESQVGNYCQLVEINVEDVYLNKATRDNLTSDELSSLSNWQLNTSGDGILSKLIIFLRRLVALVGILITLWGILFYIAFWFDRLNNIWELRICSLLSGGKLAASFTDNPEDVTYGKGSQSKSKEAKLINHRICIKIVLIAEFAGAILISGKYYDIIRTLVNFVRHFFE